MTLTIALVCAAALLLLAALAVGRSLAATAFIYGGCLVVTLVSLGAALAQLLGDAQPVTLTLPLGLPWIGAHFRLDALAAFFLAVVDLGAATASLFAIGYGRHEDAPQRVLP